jgi:hypothetical protein
MREKNYNTGLRGVLFEERHYARMGSAIWLYGWLVLRQTHQTGTTGWVLGGAPITYREIEGETGFNRRTLERWMCLLRRNSYIATEAAPGGVIVRILKAKKHLQNPSGVNANAALRVRKVAETVRIVAERYPQNCVAKRDESQIREQVAAGIGSSSVGRIKEKEQPEIHSAVEITSDLQFEKPLGTLTTYPNHYAQEIQSCEIQEFQRQFRNVAQHHDLKNSQSEKTKTTWQTQDRHQQGNQPQPETHSQYETQIQRPAASRQTPPLTQKTFPWQLRERMRLLRAERDEAVRRELAVGTGPEVRRP